MKNLFGFLVLIIILIITSFVFIHFSNSFIQPSSAEKYNSYFNKWERSFVYYCINCKQKGLDYLHKCFDIFDDTTTSDPDYVKQCSKTCPLPNIGAESLVKALSNSKEGKNF